LIPKLSSQIGEKSKQQITQAEINTQGGINSALRQGNQLVVKVTDDKTLNDERSAKANGAFSRECCATKDNLKQKVAL